MCLAFRILAFEILLQFFSLKIFPKLNQETKNKNLKVEIFMEKNVNCLEYTVLRLFSVS